jgi:predicted transcriptional regulator YdeE
MSQISIVKMDELDLMYIQATSFPEGVEEAWRKLESRLPTIKRRKFFGTSRLVGEKIEYRACVVPSDESEPSRLGLDTFTIPAGNYASKNLVDWTKQTQIKTIFEELSSKYTVDSSRPHIEIYRSQKELVLMVPIVHPY